ncbi:hypothetical protein [Natronoglomus mannanivorans]|uniref:Uncharacterized protein n=1 Tax=Natronoglomus mannanivorans TaxID=2979990 RepID=A0AAP3E3R3_9EURY|nr:hypothetical protein [Halobacteria archaeon AArc-xg1-1]
MTPNDPDPNDVPGFERSLGIDDPVPDAAYGDRGYHPERGAPDGGQTPVDELHEALLETKQELQELEKQLPEPLTLTESLRELSATADAYSRFGADYLDDPE